MCLSDLRVVITSYVKAGFSRLLNRYVNIVILSYISFYLISNVIINSTIRIIKFIKTKIIVYLTVGCTFICVFKKYITHHL